MSGSRPSAEDRADKTVVAYLPKPFDLEELFGVVRHHARTVEITHR
jgi:DNA-binding response OmpR family regulator